MVFSLGRVSCLGAVGRGQQPNCSPLWRWGHMGTRGSGIPREGEGRILREGDSGGARLT